MEASGHRDAFDPSKAESAMVSLFSLLPAVVDAVKGPGLHPESKTRQNGDMASEEGSCRINRSVHFRRSSKSA
jgi:hypothetical protein